MLIFILYYSYFIFHILARLLFISAHFGGFDSSEANILFLQSGKYLHHLTQPDKESKTESMLAYTERNQTKD